MIIIETPIPPPGHGWEMCGSAATKTTLYWFWKAVGQ